MRDINLADQESLRRPRRSRPIVLLVGVTALCLLVLSILTSTQLIHAQGGAVAPRIEGSWLITVTPAGGFPPPFPALITYSAGGGLIVTDSSFEPAIGNVYQGTWARNEGNTTHATRIDAH